MWYECLNCNFVYRSPRISSAEAKIMYQKYRNLDLRGVTADEYFHKLTNFSNEESSAFQKSKWLSQMLFQKKISLILDIGFGTGILLYHMKKFFPDCKMVGIEPNKECCLVAKNYLNISVINDYYRAELLNDKYDLILCTDVLEHLPDITKIWTDIKKNISKKGYLFIEIPSVKNFDNLSMQHDVFEAPHIYMFSRNHIEEISMNFGFSIIAQLEKTIANKVKAMYLLQKSE